MARDTGVQFVATNSQRQTAIRRRVELIPKQPSTKTVAKLHRLHVHGKDLNLPVAAISEVIGHRTK